MDEKLSVQAVQETITLEEKVKVFHVTAAFGCNREIAVETIKEVLAHIENELSESTPDIGDSLTITVGQMTRKQINELAEFDGC